VKNYRLKWSIDPGKSQRILANPSFSPPNWMGEALPAADFQTVILSPGSFGTKDLHLFFVTENPCRSFAAAQDYGFDPSQFPSRPAARQGV
jgi:hypothetical protein